MPRKEGQKRKLLVLLEILIRETDEKHPLSVPQLVEKLQERGIEAERKSVYGDLNTLNSLPGAPYEIVQLRGRGGGKSGIHPAPGEPDGHHHPDGGPHAGP